MTTAIDLGAARARAESLMTATCTIRATSAAPTTDPATGEVVFPAGATVYSGRCRVRPVTSRGGGEVIVGGAEAFTFDYLVSVPFAVTTVAEGQRVTIDFSPDPALIGVQVEIQKVDRGEQITARRLSCTDVT